MHRGEERMVHGGGEEGMGMYVHDVLQGVKMTQCYSPHCKQHTLSDPYHQVFPTVLHETLIVLPLVSLHKTHCRIKRSPLHMPHPHSY